MTQYLFMKNIPGMDEKASKEEGLMIGQQNRFQFISFFFHSSPIFSQVYIQFLSVL